MSPGATTFTLGPELHVGAMTPADETCMPTEIIKTHKGNS